jgi:hypothetical protein
MKSEAAGALPGGGDTGRDWRLWFGLASTLFWLWLALAYIAIVVGWSNFLRQPADALGSFLEGAFSPLAFLWLVIGFFLQQRELRSNNAAIQRQYQEMRRQVEQAEAQALALRENALHQRQETFLLVADRVHRQLGSVAGFLWMSSHGPGNPAAASEELITDLWSRLGAGDPETFARQCMAFYLRHRGDRRTVWDFFFGTPVRTRHSETILETFDRLLASARACDPDGIIVDALRGSGHGLVHQAIAELKAQGPPPAAGEGGGI